MTAQAYATVEQFLEFIGDEDSLDTEDENLIQRLLLAARAIIDQKTERIFIAEQAEVQIMTGENPAAILRLPAEFLQIDSVRVFELDGSGGTDLTQGSDYVPVPLDPPFRSLRALPGYAWPSFRIVKVSGQKGYSTEPPEDIIQASLRLALWLYRQRDSSVFDVTATHDLGQISVSSRGLPSDVKEILALRKFITV